MTTVPRPTALLIAFWYVLSHEPPPPSDMLMTFAGVGLAGMPLTVPPDAQMIASAMSASEPPHLPRTRTGCTFAPNATPATPVPLFVTAATVPATCVPCHEEFWLGGTGGGPHSAFVHQSPWSFGFESRPSPSRDAVVLEMKS